MVAWSGVLLVATHQSHTPVVLGQYGWGQASLLGLLLCGAVMAEHLTNNAVSYWANKSSHASVVSQGQEASSRVMSPPNKITTFARCCAQTISEATYFLVAVFIFCRRLTHRLMCKVPHF